jgi:hypothetical protein
MKQQLIKIKELALLESQGLLENQGVSIQLINKVNKNNQFKRIKKIWI